MVIFWSVRRSKPDGSPTPGENPALLWPSTRPEVFDPHPITAMPDADLGVGAVLKVMAE
jgi:hypothetical protein